VESESLRAVDVEKLGQPSVLLGGKSLERPLAATLLGRLSRLEVLRWHTELEQLGELQSPPWRIKLEYQSASNPSVSA